MVALLSPLRGGGGVVTVFLSQYSTLKTRWRLDVVTT